ncbi:MAG TPA: hypothetical protein VF533_10215 [Solirubrobacteraceae bacterium]
MTAFRIGLPLAMVALGVALIVAGGSQADAAGVTIVGSAALVWLAGALLRSSVRDEAEREAEEAARQYYREHGRWPDEE